MPIKVTCKCGKALNVKDELGGKTVKCPGCQQPLKIPAGAGAAAAAPKSAAPAKPAASTQSDLFDELGLKPLEVGAMPCPGCKEPLGKNAIVCVKCGYNMNLGRRMTTQTSAAAGGGHEGGHGDVAAGLMERAAQVIDEDEEEAEKKTSEGLPWWVYLIVLIVLVGFLGTMMVIAARKESKPKDEKAGWTLPVAEFARIRIV